MGKLAVANDSRTRTRGTTIEASGPPAASTVIASGGTVTIAGGYVYHTFTANDYLRVYQAGLVEYLLVGGGGGGGSGPGSGGGGAGEYEEYTGATLAVGNYPVVIGAGGTGGNNTTEPTAGGNTTFNSKTALGGGDGGQQKNGGSSVNGASGGSGGGGGYSTSATGGASTASGGGFGNAGGVTSASAAGRAGGGGGGAGAAGAAGSGYAGGNGGNGKTWVDGNTYGGGGGGGSRTDDGGSPTAGTGGTGGGGAGKTDSTAATNGTANTGGGGGGSGYSGTYAAGGNGGSGVVICRYPTDGLLAGLYATGGTITEDGNYIRHTFTADDTFALAQKGLLATEYLAVGGGGGGGSNMAGGGGGGEVLSGTANINANAAVTIGAGGSGGLNASGTAGGDTIITGLITANGGGFGGKGSTGAANGGNGGNGGGGGGNNAGGAGSGGTGDQFNGGNGTTTGPPWSGGGGGGASQVGANAIPSSAGGAGGNGVTWNGTVYGGGGGGGSTSGGVGGTGGAGGTGGGGAGSNFSGDGTAGTTNRGGGGGGAGSNLSTGGAGGTGIVVIRYQPGSFEPGNPMGWYSTTLEFYVDGTTGVTDAGAGAVSQWDDLSSNANHLKQATATNRPLTGANTSAGLNTIDFDGTDNWMQGDNFSMDVSGKAVTIASVSKWDATGTGKAMYCGINAGGSPIMCHMYENNGGNYQLVYGTGNSVFDASRYRERAMSPNPGTAAYRRQLWTIDTTSGPQMYLAGSAATMSNVGGGTMNPASFLTTDSTAWKPIVGRRPDPFYWDGKIGFVAQWSEVLSAGDRTLVDNWMSAKWGGT